MPSSLHTIYRGVASTEVFLGSAFSSYQTSGHGHCRPRGGIGQSCREALASPRCAYGCKHLSNDPSKRDCPKTEENPYTDTFRRSTCATRKTVVQCARSRPRYHAGASRLRVAPRVRVYTASAALACWLRTERARVSPVLIAPPCPPPSGVPTVRARVSRSAQALQLQQLLLLSTATGACLRNRGRAAGMGACARV